MGATASVLEGKDLTSDDVSQVLDKIHFSQYAELVRSKKFDKTILDKLNHEGDLLQYIGEIGVSDEMHQLQIATSLMALNSGKSDPSALVRVDTMANLHSGNLTPEQLVADLVRFPNRIEERGEITGFGEGCTPLMAACYFGNMLVIPIFISNGADINAVSTYENNTSLMLAAMCGNEEIVEYLLGLSVDINAVNKAGWTALMFACSNVYMSIAMLLVSRGATTDAVDNEGNTALTLLDDGDDKRALQEAIDSFKVTVFSPTKAKTKKLPNKSTH